MSLSKSSLELFNQIFDNLLCFYTDSLNMSTQLVYDLLGLHSIHVRSIYLQSPQLALVDIVLDQPEDIDLILACGGTRIYQGRAIHLRIVPCWKDLLADFISDYAHFLGSRKIVHGAINPNYFFLNPGFLPANVMDPVQDWDNSATPASNTDFDPDKVIKVESSDDETTSSPVVVPSSSTQSASEASSSPTTVSAGSDSDLPAPAHPNQFHGITLPPIDTSSDEDMPTTSTPKRIVRLRPRSPSTSPPF